MSPGKDLSHLGCADAPLVREVKDEVGTRGVEILFAVAADPDSLLALLWDVQNFPRLFPDIKAFSVVGQGEGDPPEALDVSYRIDAVVRELGYVLRRVLHGPKRTITWKELSGDLRRVRGGWWIHEGKEPEVSLVTYRAFVDVGRFVPTGLIAKIAKRKAREMVDRVRQVAAEI